ncbi:hypothetical protein HBB16_08070 [Pseudonocardia sp. MCCB 268]|nr:hypothetical protein [Pseudonocardia cytotoxica]
MWALISSMTPTTAILDISRGNDSNGYIGNYHRWFGVPEAPFGWFTSCTFAVERDLGRRAVAAGPGLVMGIISLVPDQPALLRLGTRVRRSRIRGLGRLPGCSCASGCRSATGCAGDGRDDRRAGVVRDGAGTRRPTAAAGRGRAGGRAFAVAATPTGLIALTRSSRPRGHC